MHDQDFYAQAEWSPVTALSLLAGVRHSDVRFTSDDHYITFDNPNDSGAVAYSHTSPVAGVVWHATKDLNLYANAGNGFETPTFIELAYQNVGTGLNFGLQPAISRSVEIGAKGFISDTQRFTLAAYDTKTTNEIIIDSATGGRTTYKNASRTKRHGVEAEWEGVLGKGFTAYASYTYISAKFAEPTTTGTPPLPVPAGARLPAVPANATYGELAWSRPDWSGFSTALEFQYADKLYVNDRNTDASAAYAIVNIRTGVEQRKGIWTLREFIRINNLTDKNYVGSVIVGEHQQSLSSSPQPAAISSPVSPSMPGF